MKKCQRHIPFYGLFILFFFCLGCSQHGAQWKSYRDRPSLLIAETKIYDSKKAVWVSWPELIGSIQKRPVLLLGEIHDNPYHHLLQASLIRAFLSSGNSVAVGFEQISQDNQGVLNRFQEEGSGDLGILRDTLKWKESGWPDWEIYEKVFEESLSQQAQLVALNLTRDDLSVLRKTDFEADLKKWPFLAKKFSLSQGLRQEIRDDLVKSHPFEVSADLLEAMLRIQNAKDWFMAKQISSHLQTSVSKFVGIMGREHVRKDRGVGFYLFRMGTKSFSSLCLMSKDEYSSRMQSLTRPKNQSFNACDFYIYSL